MIRRRLLVPFLIVLAAVPLINILAFNFFINSYIEKSVNDQLIHTAVNSKVLIKKELSAIVFETDKEKIGEVLEEVNRILRTTKTNLNVELMLFAENGELLYPIEFNDTFLNSDVIDSIRGILGELDETDPEKLKTGQGTVSAAGYKLSDLPISSIPYVVFVSSLDIADSLIVTVNRILIIVFAAGLIIGTVIIAAVSEGIVKSVAELRSGAKGISLFRRYEPSGNITTNELRELAACISDASDRIIKYDQVQKAFLQNASHEIRTPLMSIQGYAEGIEKSMFDDPVRAAAVINGESRKLAKLLDELLMISRIDNRNYDDSFEAVSIASVLLEYENPLKGLALNNNRELTIIPPQQDIKIRYNDTLFSQLIMNVAGNAFRYSESRVVISTETDDDWCVISIEDDGPGIDPNDLPYLFDRFYKGTGGQTGLGLAIAQTAAEAMGGSISAVNASKGARFCIRLPMLV